MVIPTVLFVPCVSNAFLGQFWTDMEEHDATVRNILEHPDFQIMPVMIRPTETGARMAHPSEPLCAYEGYHREVACQQIASMIEAALIASGHYQPAETPLTMLFSSAATIQAVIAPQRDTTTVDILTETFAPVKTLLEQASMHIVESKQLAIAERSQRLAAEEDAQKTERQAIQEQMEEIRQHLTAIQKEQNANIFSKMGRWLKPTK